MLDRLTDPREIYAAIFDRLENAVQSMEHSLKLASVATINALTLDQRMIVLRAADRSNGTLTFFTDNRSTKIQSIRQSPQLHWLFYDPIEKLQLRMLTSASIHHEDRVSKGFWKSVPASNQINYATQLPPGAQLESKPDQYDLDHQQAHSNFAAVVCAIEHIEILQLFRDIHRRASLKTTKNGWKLDWLVP